MLQLCGLRKKVLQQKKQKEKETQNEIQNKIGEKKTKLREWPYTHTHIDTNVTMSSKQSVQSYGPVWSHERSITLLSLFSQ